MVSLYDSVVSIDAGNYKNKIIASRRAVFGTHTPKFPVVSVLLFFPAKNLDSPRRP